MQESGENQKDNFKGQCIVKTMWNLYKSTTKHNPPGLQAVNL